MRGLKALAAQNGFLGAQTGFTQAAPFDSAQGPAERFGLHCCAI